VAKGANPQKAPFRHFVAKGANPQKAPFRHFVAKGANPQNACIFSNKWQKVLVISLHFFKEMAKLISIKCFYEI
jgi:hypothetical protein